MKLIEYFSNLKYKYIIWGILCFSSFYRLLPYPFSSIDLYLLIFVIAERNKLNFRFSKSILIEIVCLIIFIVAGVIDNQDYNYDRIIFVTRIWGYVLIFAHLFYKSKLLNDNILWEISLGSTIGMIIFALNRFSLVTEGEITYLCPNLVTIPFFVAISMKKNRIEKIITAVSLLLMGAISQTRGIVLDIIVCYLICAFLIFFKKSSKNKVAVVLILCCSIFVLNYIYTSIEKQVESYDTYLHYRLYDKFESIGDNESDEIRKASYARLLSDWNELLLPHGVYMRNNEWNRSLSHGGRRYGVNDSGYAELIYSIGYLIVIPLIMYFVFIARSTKNKGKNNIFVLQLSVYSLLFFLITGYAIFRSPYTMCFWGVFIAYCKTLNNERNFFTQKV